MTGPNPKTRQPKGIPANTAGAAPTAVSRVPRGTPTGGQFAASAKAESGVDLSIASAAGKHDWSGDLVDVDGQAWHKVDADDRYPGMYDAHVANRDGFTLRITPGDHASFAADGFQWTASNGHDSFSGVETTRDIAAWQAAEAADYVTSGEAEAADYAMGLMEADGSY